MKSLFLKKRGQIHKRKERGQEPVPSNEETLSKVETIIKGVLEGLGEENGVINRIIGNHILRVDLIGVPEASFYTICEDNGLDSELYGA